MKLRGKEMLEAVEFGQKVYFITGPGEFPEEGMCEASGTVVQKIESRWGWSLAIDVNEYVDGVHRTTPRYRHVHNLRSLDECGVGAYTDL